ISNPKPETRNPKPETRNPKPETRNPKPETIPPSDNGCPGKSTTRCKYLFKNIGFYATHIALVNIPVFCNLIFMPAR
ncbi:hypothetical protein T484DRAFT_1619120, partial [Baffinella frigidus]